MTCQAVIESMLDLCSVMLQVENMATIRVALMKLFKPLAKHTASLISTSEEHETLRYAIAQSLLCLTKAMIDSGLAKLSAPQKEYVRQCESAARAFIMAVDNRPHLTEEDLADANGDDCPLKTFEDLIKRRVSEELLHDQNS